MKVQDFGILGTYGNKDVFEKMIKEGYTEVAFGSGDWIDNPEDSSQRIKMGGMFAFYHPTEKVVKTYETIKIGGDESFRSEPQEVKHKKGVVEHLNKFKVNMGEKTSLVEVVERWSE